MLSIIYGPGTVAPEISPLTVALGFVLIVPEYLFVREAARQNKRPITPGWITTTIVLLAALLIPEGFILLIMSVLWAIILPLLGIYIAVLAYILFIKTHTAASAGKKLPPHKR